MIPLQKPRVSLPAVRLPESTSDAPHIDRGVIDRKSARRTLCCRRLASARAFPMARLASSSGEAGHCSWQKAVSSLATRCWLPTRSITPTVVNQSAPSAHLGQLSVATLGKTEGYGRLRGGQPVLFLVPSLKE